MLKIYNTLTKRKEVFKPFIMSRVRMFVCGPTVYDYPHIGNARTYVAFDIIVRYLHSLGWNVFYLQNITDIDDKIIARAKKEKISWRKIADTYEKIYHQNEKKLGIVSVTKYARATDFIHQIVKQVQTLIKKGYAYKIKRDGYYFDISKFKDYGKLSKRTTQQAEDATSRIDRSVKKRNRGDFNLWKLSTLQRRGEARFRETTKEPIWQTPLGPGRPGWHIEDTAISEHYFGPQYDLHGGAVDLKFPHHEAEIAQQEAASGRKPFVKIWMHTGFLLVNDKKMSKSLGNFISINDFLKKHSGELFRLLILFHHYRSPVNYTEALLKQTESSLQTLQEFIEKLDFLRVTAKEETKSKVVKQRINKLEGEFHQAMEDDFNTPMAMAVIFDLIKELNPRVWALSKKEAILIKKFILGSLKTLGLEIKIEKIPQKIKEIVKERELLRTHKQFIQADVLRNKIKRLGYVVEDTPSGPFVTIKSKS